MPTIPTRAAPDIADALRYFDQLPDSAYVRLPVVAALLGISPMTVWRWSRSGRLPRPKKVGPKVTAWNVGELRKAQVATGPAPS